MALTVALVHGIHFSIRQKHYLPHYLDHIWSHKSTKKWKAGLAEALPDEMSSVVLCTADDRNKEDLIAANEKIKDTDMKKGHSMITVCDTLIDFFLAEKEEPNEWKCFLAFRKEWNKIKPHFYRRCKVRMVAEKDVEKKKRLHELSGKVKEIDNQVQRHDDLLKEVRENSSEISIVVAMRRREFTGNFFDYLKLVADTHPDSLSFRDEMAGLAATCLAAVQAYDNAIADDQAVKSAMNKLNAILDSTSLEAACQKIDNLAKSKQLDSTTLILITKTWASAKNSLKIKNEAKDIMHQLYLVAKENLLRLVPKEVEVIKQLLSVRDPEQRMEALASAFSPGDELQAKSVCNTYTTPRKLCKWLKKILDAYYNNKRMTLIEEARQFMDPLVIQRLEYLLEVVEEEYL